MIISKTSSRFPRWNQPVRRVHRNFHRASVYRGASISATSISQDVEARITRAIVSFAAVYPRRARSILQLFPDHRPLLVRQGSSFIVRFLERRESVTLPRRSHGEKCL